MLNSVIIVGAVRSACLMCATMIIARFLGAAEYGTFAYIVSIMTAVKLFSDPGFPNAFAALAKKDEITAGYIRRIWLMLGAFHTTALISVLCGFWLFNALEKINVSYLLLILGFFAVMLQQSVWPLLLQTAEKFNLSIRSQTAHLLCSLVLLLVIIILGASGALSVLRIFIAYIICYALLCLCFFITLSRFYKSDQAITIGNFFGSYFGFIKALFFVGVINGLGDVLFRSVFKIAMSESDFGVFSVGFQLIYMTTVFSVVAMPTLNNKLSEAFSESLESASMVLKYAIDKITVFVVLSFGIVMCGIPVLISLLGGAEYSGISSISVLAPLCAVVQFLGQLATIMLLSDQKYATLLYCTLCSMVVNATFVSLFYFVWRAGALPGGEVSSVHCMSLFLVMNVLSAGILCFQVFRLQRSYFKYLTYIVFYMPALITPILLGVGRGTLEANVYITSGFEVLVFFCVFLVNRIFLTKMRSSFGF